MLWGLLALAAAYAAVVFLGSRWRNPRFGPLPVRAMGTAPPAGEEITITTWNIGFAALGAKADFILDNGKHLRALSRAEISTAAYAIAQDLAKDPADVLLLQETAQAGFLTRGVPVQQTLEAALPRHQHHYWADMATVAAPPGLQINHGLATAALCKVASAEAVKLSPAPLIHRGLLKKYYAGLITRLPIRDSQACWVIINLHLSAFDKTADAKTAQIEALFDFARAEHARGHPVIIGGDWNMLMAETTFPHAAHLAHGDWVYDFPTHLIPDGWQQVADASVPTVRSMQQAYVEGENEVMIIDGFITSPDVEVVQVSTRATGFAHTDHHPVTARFAQRLR